MNMIQTSRLVRDLASFYGDVLGISSVAPHVRPAVNLVARFPLRHARADGLDHARNVPAQDERERILAEAPHISRADLPIDRVHRRSMNLYQNFFGGRF